MTSHLNAVPVLTDTFLSRTRSHRKERRRCSAARCVFAAWLLLAMCLGATGCGDGDGDGDGRATITVWAHHGKPAEWETIQRQVEAFNASQNEVRAELIEIPQDNYDTQVQSAAASGELPDVLELDGPNLANYAWKGYLIPIGDRLDDELREDLLPSIVEQGQYAGRFYAVGVFDSGLGLYANRSMLEAVDARAQGHRRRVDDRRVQRPARQARAARKRIGRRRAGAGREARLSR